MFLLRGNAIAHEAVALLDFFIAAFDHAADHYIRLRIELVELHPQMRGVLRGVHLGGLGPGLLIDQLECIRVGEEGGQFFLEMVGLPGVLVDVVFDADLCGKVSTRYMSLSCWTSSML
jgi:hypothetical protein